jgi:hypothetical protein
LATVSWQTRGASKRLEIANRLLRVLACHIQANQASQLVTRHLAGNRNALTDIPSRSFGWTTDWHFEDDLKFLTFFNARFPLPLQNCWTGFCLNNAVSSKVISELLMQASSMDAWRRLPKLGRKYGKSGRPIAEPLELIRTWTASPLPQLPGSAQVLEADYEKGNVEGPSALEVFVPDLGVSARRSL